MAARTHRLSTTFFVYAHKYVGLSTVRSEMTVACRLLYSRLL
jgi:hypothetical protein